MPVIDTIGKTIIQTKQDAIHITKKIAEGNKLNTSIVEEERKIKEFATNIGNIYYVKYGHEPEEAFREMVEGIKTSQKKITLYKKQLQDLSKEITCGACGAKVAKDSKYCNACGVEISTPRVDPRNDPSIKSCRQCGKKLKEKDLFCTNCGTRVEYFPQPEEKKCSICGKVLKSEAKFCTKCGTVVS